MPSTPKSRISKKQRQIVETAIELFSRFGIKRVTVEEICQKAGASKMTFYKYFPNKMELLKHIWNGWIDEAYKRLDEIDEMNISFAEKLQKIIEYKTELLSKVSPEYMQEVLHAEPEMEEFIGEVQARNFGLFMKFLEKAQARGDMRKIRPEFFLTVLDKINELARDESLMKIYPNHVELMREIQYFLFYGILPVENRESQ